MELADIVIYPVKSMRGISVPRVAVEREGLAFDRRWMVVREDTGRFLSQREVPKMCLVRPELVPAGAPALGTRRALAAESGDAALILHPPPGVPLPPLRVPLAHPQDASAAARTATVWGFTGAALDEGDEAAEWISRAIFGDGGGGGGAAGAAAASSSSSTSAPSSSKGRRVRLVRHAPELRGGARAADPDFGLPGSTVGFADGYPVLAATEGSLADLNARVREQRGLPSSAPDLAMSRFRPNLVFHGGEATDAPWSDDGWARVRVGNGNGGCEFAYVKPCSRCKVTTVDQETGETTRAGAGAAAGAGAGAGDDEPLATLRAFRSGSALGWDHNRPSFRHAVHFGWNLQPLQPLAPEGEEERGQEQQRAYAGEGPLCVLERGSRVEVAARRRWE